MAVHHSCDACGSRLIEPEVSTLTLTGPARSLSGRRALHLGKCCVYAILRDGFHFPVVEPETMVDDLAARRQSILANGTPAGTTAPPKGRGRAKPA